MAAETPPANIPPAFPRGRIPMHALRLRHSLSLSPKSVTPDPNTKLGKFILPPAIARHA
ncbi:hypothetical protein EKH55_0837 [Sinorhizobium alkalisoli]|nr:hypothetical protein EKH55_0837 [Sinorhizobium alkalisoli]